MLIEQSTRRVKRAVESLQDRAVSEDPHPSATRLLAAARAWTAGSPTPINTWSELRDAMGLTGQAMYNWQKRGVCMEGALEAAKKFGVDANWILDGIHRTRTLPDALVSRLVARDSDPSATSTAELLEQVGMLLAQTPISMRASIGAVLSAWAISGGADDHRQALVTLFAASPKQPLTG